jgi:hypothetical protein
MRGRTKAAEGTIVSVQRSGTGGVSTSKKGERRTFDFVVDVRPPDEPPFRAEVRRRAWSEACPSIGDVVRVSYRVKDRATEIDIDDDPRYQPLDHDVVRRISEQSSILLHEMTTLQRDGVAARATVLSVVEHPLPPQFKDETAQFELTVQVHAPDGSDFPATFGLMFPKQSVPEVGASTWVSYDPNNRAYVRYRPGGNPVASVAPEVRWRVPESCPTCGAPVDQSRATVAPHPTCAMCHVPLPCEPVAGT